MLEMDTFQNSFSALLNDSELGNQFLPPLNAKELQTIQRLLDPVVAEASSWCSRFSLLKPTLVLPASVAAIVQLSHLPAAAIATRVKATLWIPAIDDMFDERSLGEEPVTDIVRECVGIACNPSPPPTASSPYGEMLLLIRNELAAFPLWPVVQPLWAVSLSRVLDGSMYEYWLGSRFRSLGRVDHLALFEEYLYYARHSIAFAYLLITSLILESDLSIVKALPSLVFLAEQCGAALRFANDLATYRREEHEGDINAVVLMTAEILARDPSIPAEAAIQEALAVLRSRLQMERDKACRMAEAIITESHVERRFLRAMEFGIDFYQRQDFREWTANLDRELARVSEGIGQERPV